MKKVLLTGASGFIGRQAIPALLARGYEVHAISTRAMEALSDGVFNHQLDLFNTNQTSQLIAEIRPSHLLHFAWYAVHGKFWTAQENLHWVKASIDLLQQFVLHGGKRVVMAGTCAEYDWSTNGLCEEKTTPLIPATLYGTCKAALYQIMEAYAQQIGLSHAWGRIFHLYGPHEHPGRLAPSVINSFLQNEIARCSHGTQLRDFMHVEDVADAFVALLDSEVQGAINIASGQAVALKEMINQIASKMNGQVEYGAISSSKSDPLYLVADIRRLREELNWRPRNSLNNGLNKSIAWWSQQKSNQKVIK